MTATTTKKIEPTIPDMNKTIAVFMGAKIDKEGRVYGLSAKGHYRAETLTYHVYWDALMPVFEKIKMSGRYSYELGTMKNTEYNFVAIADVSHVNFFIAHTFKRDLKAIGINYTDISGKELLNQMINRKLTSVEDITEAWKQVKSEYKNDISENVASKRENAKQDNPVSYREYDMTDTHGNRLYSKGATVYLRLAKGEHRKLGVIDPKQKVFAVKRERAKHLFRKNNSYGFNHHFLSTPTIAFNKILLEDDYGKFLIPVKYLLEQAKFLNFLQKGFERQIFLQLERIETFKQDDAKSVEGAEDEIVKE